MKFVLTVATNTVFYNCWCISIAVNATAQADAVSRCKQTTCAMRSDARCPAVDSATAAYLQLLLEV